MNYKHLTALQIIVSVSFPDALATNSDDGVRECLLTELGFDYQGTINVTESGKTCQMWSSQIPHAHLCTAVIGRENYCTNPDGFPGIYPNCVGLRPWCYTMNVFVLWEYCDIDMCDGFHHWSYTGENDGPAQWPSLYPQCGGNLQSPINLKAKDALDMFIGWRTSFVSFGYMDAQGASKMLNDGRSLIVKMLGGEWKISGSIFQFTTYSLRTISFHYSSNRTIGSEHRLEGKVYPLEITLLHEKTEGRRRASQFASISVLVQVGGPNNRGFNALIRASRCATFKGVEAQLQPFRVRGLLPQDTGLYYSYDGSITHPPCTQGVHKLVFAHPVNISARQMEVLWRVKRVTKGFYNRPETWGSKTIDDHFLQSTFRPIVQHNETRKILRVHRVGSSDAGRAMINRNAILPFIFMLCCCICA